MGLCQSITDIEEIPAYLQKGFHLDGMCSYLYQFISSPKGTIMTETAKFDEPKPYTLQVSDDTWASLRLRVDPLARAILEPHRLYIGAGLLCLLLGIALAAVRPDFSLEVDADDDLNASFNSGYYAADDQVAADDDFWKASNVNYNEWQYKNRAVRREKLAWNFGFLLFFAAVIGATGMVSWMMESRNTRVDDFIGEVCGELSGRFEQEGYAIHYNTRIQTEGMVMGHLFPERAICFRELSEEEVRERRSNATYTPPDADPESPAKKTSKKKKKKEAAFGSINVMVPDGFTSGQVVNVMTPSGLPIMVAVPNDILPGQTFPVQIPAQMYRPRK